MSAKMSDNTVLQKLAEQQFPGATMGDAHGPQPEHARVRRREFDLALYRIGAQVR
jgi:hypothetical protein